MAYATAPDGVRLYYEEAGTGTPIVFVHEFSGDLRSWEAQIQFFSRRYRCIAFNARGYQVRDVLERLKRLDLLHTTVGGLDGEPAYTLTAAGRSLLQLRDARPRTA